MRTQGEWSAGLTRSIAKNLRRIRKAKGLSARELSETCAVLLFDIPRTTISDLENGRRLFITVSELLMLARVLEVSPVDLVFPVDAGGDVMIAPEEPYSPAVAGEWWSGHIKIVGVGKAVLEYAQPDGNDPRSLFREHERLVKAIRYVARTADAAPVPDALREAQDVLRTEMLQLTRLRQSIRAAGFPLPGLPDDLAFL